jgi:hypothetical protein
MWSLTSQRARRTSGPENFQSQAKKDFFNTIGAKRPFAYEPNVGTRAFSADTIVLTSSIVIVIGPTPLGTGVMNEAFAERLRNRRRPRPAVGHPVAYVNHNGASFSHDHRPREVAWVTSWVKPTNARF